MSGPRWQTLICARCSWPICSRTGLHRLWRACPRRKWGAWLRSLAGPRTFIAHSQIFAIRRSDALSTLRLAGHSGRLHYSADASPRISCGKESPGPAHRVQPGDHAVRQRDQIAAPPRPASFQLGSDRREGAAVGGAFVRFVGLRTVCHYPVISHKAWPANGGCFGVDLSAARDVGACQT
jgi:hypothetical protein